MDINRVIQFAGKDPNWVNKLVLGAALSLVPIVNLTAAGYGANLFRNVLAGREDSEVLPEWTNWQDHFMKGLVLFLIGLGYMIVPLAMMAVALVPMIAGVLDGRGPTMAFGLAGTMAILGLAVCLALVLTVLSLMGCSLYAESGSAGDAFQFGEILRRIMAAPIEFLMAFLVLVLGGMVASALAGWIPVVGGLLVNGLAFPVQLMFWYAMGQMFREHFSGPPQLEL